MKASTRRLKRIEANQVKACVKRLLKIKYMQLGHTNYCGNKEIIEAHIRRLELILTKSSTDFNQAIHFPSQGKISIEYLLMQIH